MLPVCGHDKRFCDWRDEMEVCVVCLLEERGGKIRALETERDLWRLRFEGEQKRVIELLDDLLALRQQVRKWEARATAAGGNEATNAAEMRAFLRKEPEKPA